MDTKFFTVEGAVLKLPTPSYQPVEPFVRIIQAVDEADARRQVAQLSSPFVPIVVDRVAVHHG